MTDRASIGRAGLVLLTLAALALALWTGGGPAAGQREARDATRLDDLQALAGFALCLADEDGAVPDTLHDHPACAPMPRLADPYDGTPYGYARIPDDSFRLCATFEAPDMVPVRSGPTGRFDPASGCLTTRRDPR
ncbi:MAG: hypothetical protein H3C51_07310 [Rubellimicrobium sp.]|nr:hypothetical protein [Rubellimicrobium sp.]